jgi:signal transduction histidine kinase
MDNMDKYSILIVDDEPDILASLTDVFMDSYNVYRANSAKEALAILQDNKIDLIISDQRMPETTGVELFAQVDARFPEIGKVLLSGYSDITATIEAINRGHIDKYISKPWDEKVLLHIVLEVINARYQKIVVDMKSVESQLVNSAKLASLGELVAGVAHEMNNPLSFIHSNLRNMSKFVSKMMELIDLFERDDLPPQLKTDVAAKKTEINYAYLKTRLTEMIERSMVGTERLTKIIADLRTFTRMDSSEMTEADINDALEITTSFVTYEFKERITVVKNFGSIPKVTCFIQRLSQVFLNLLVNAGHAIEGQGSITIRTAQEGGMVRIDITDTGSGIPEDKIKKIFEPFFTTKPIGKGTGLGLSISSDIIKQHKGVIEVQSKVGEGTTFTLKIPIAGAAVT